jgi:hypothetical protein
MTFEWTAATNRFDSASFSNEVVAGRSLPPTATYTCPRCDHLVGFRREHFETASRRTSNFENDVASQFDDEGRGRGHADLGFVDWCCPGCGLLVRAYVRTWAGGRHGDSGADIIEVVEGR